MNKKILLLLLFLGLHFFADAQINIDTDKNRWKPYYIDASPSAIAVNWFLPFEVADRKDIKQLKIISIFGDHRDSFLKGHMHTAIDVNPLKPTSKLIPVYAMAKGIVCSVHLGENQQTVVLKHQLKDGQVIFSSYKHLKEVYVRQGQQVDEKTKIARLFTVQESKKYGGDYHHLHLEIRRRFDDYGCASWLTMNKKELDLRFFNPLVFLKEKLKV